MPETQYRLIRDDGTEYPVGPSSLTMGRSRQNGIVIRDSSVSRHHATLLLAQGRCWIRDQGSTHGTFVNGQPVSGQQEVGPGDVVFVPPHSQHTYVNGGDVTFKFLCGIPVSRLREQS